MDLYSSVSLSISKLLTTRYSSSFSASSLLFSRSIRPQIYSIYGLVRIADEIVDTYDGADQKALLDRLEKDTYESIDRGYSPNPIVHSFATTARQYSIGKELIAPFFDSMRADINPPRQLTDDQYRQYIVGSAEVVGLMCLRVFTAGDEATYSKLSKGASHLGAAYQKVNFLRDFADDYKRLSRVYFPGLDYASFDDMAKKEIEQDIEQDFQLALEATMQLPRSSRRAVYASYKIYYRLLEKLRAASASTVKQKRIRVSTPEKLLLVLTSVVRTGL